MNFLSLNLKVNGKASYTISRGERFVHRTSFHKDDLLLVLTSQ